MSKLKRKKAAADETKASPLILKRTADTRLVNALAEAARVGAGSAWWRREDLPEEQRLWFIGLQEFCPNVFGDHWNLCVPRLPHPVESSPLPSVHSPPPECSSSPSTIVLPHPDLQSHCSSIPLHPDQQKRTCGAEARSVCDGAVETPETCAVRPELRWNTAVEPASASEGVMQISVGAGSAWWRRDDLPEEQRLWFIGLQEFCPNVFGDLWNLCVPKLPESPVVTQWCWCGCRSVDEDVSGHPVESSPLPSVHSPPPECSISPSTIVLPHPDLHSHCSSSPLHQDQQKRTCGAEARSVCDGAVETSETCAVIPELRWNTAVEPASASEVKMDCCPMCLIVFPTGFSQMQCDEHLAQCLSELHTDVTW